MQYHIFYRTKFFTIGVFMRKITFLGIIATIALIVGSCGDSSTNADNNGPAITSISPTTAWRRDTITIVTERFGTDTANISVQIDTFIIKPIFVGNNVIKVIIPDGITKSKYDVVVRTSSESARSIQKITFDPNFNFRRAEISVNLKGSNPQNGNPVQNLMNSIYIYRCEGYTKGNPIEFSLGCNTGLSGNSTSKRVTATVDNASKIITKFYAKDYKYEYTRTGPGPFNSIINITDFSLNLQNAHYTEFNDRIEINYSGQSLSEIIPKVNYQNNSYSFISSVDYSNDTYVKIILYY